MIQSILDRLQSMANPEALNGMRRYGITTEKRLGISIPNLRALAKEIGKNHDLALQLWEKEIDEARILSSMIDEIDQISEEQMDQWVKDFNSWDVCDQVCQNLFDKTAMAKQKALEWSNSDEEFVKRAGFVLMARLAVVNKKAEDDFFMDFFPIMIRECDDDRNFVKKAINWALRQIGKKNRSLNSQAIKIAEEMEQLESKNAKWIAKDALRELKSDAVQKRHKD